MTYRRLLWLVLVAVALLGGTRADAGVSYQNPAGGWTYTYGGTFNAPVVDNQFVGGVGPAGYGKPNDSEALDGTWYHDQSDKWDGSGPGDTGPAPTGPAPGGASSLTESGATFIRVQDPGNPEVHGYVQGAQDPVNTNRRVYFGHSIADDYGGDGEPVEPPAVNGRNWQRLLDNGITVSFRMRIPYTGALDPIYPQSGGPTEPWFAPPDADYNSNGVVDTADYVLWRKGGPLTNEVDTPGTVNAADYTEWRKRFGNQGIGRGYPIHDDGRSMVTVMQHNGDENDPFYGTDGTVAFSLVTSKDVESICEVAPGATICSGNPDVGGLIMNNGSGDTPNNNIDSFDAGQTLNLLPIPDDALDDWHEFWITIIDPNQSDTNNNVMGTKTVNVYMDGSTTPTTFQVTMSSNNNGAYANFNAAFLEFGLSSTDLFGSFDMDFISYKHGVIIPVPAGSGGGSSVPEPVSAVLMLLALSQFALRRLH
jgi:hypothetical protein